MSLTTPIGPELNILEPCSEQCERLVIEQPILSLEDLFVLKNIKYRNFKVSNNLFFKHKTAINIDSICFINTGVHYQHSI